MAISSFVSILPYLTILFILYEVFQFFTSPLRKIPGPFIAKFTNLWRLYNTYEGRPELRQRQLHEQYGPVVRIGPKCVSLSDPTLIKIIYDARGNFVKSDYSSVNDVKAGRVIIENIFSTRSNSYHSAQQRLLHKHYTMASLKEFEPLVDKTIANFQRRLEEEFVDGWNEGRVCKMDEWLLFFAWDVIGQITFSKPMGFLHKGGDINDMLKTAEKAIDYFAPICQMPWLDQLLDKNPIMRIGPPSFGAAAGFCASQAMNRVVGLDKYHSDRQKDFLDYFIDLKKLYPDQVDDNQIVSFLLINIIAGSDTTASALRAIIYYVLRNPHVHKRLLAELDNSQFPSQQPPLSLSYDNAIKLPYLTAVIQEAMRMHPGIGLLLERIVPDPGLTLPDGTFLKPGTIVGINPWVVHLDKRVFGEDAAAFVPERWLRGVGESEEAFKRRVMEMKGADLTFGAGKRSCIGKNISLLDIYKVVPMLFLRYDMQFVDPLKEWKIQNSWFVRQTDMDVRIRLRGT